MRFPGITMPSWVSRCACSSIAILALAGPVLADSYNSPHGSPHGSSSYGKKPHDGHDFGHAGFGAHGDTHHSKGHPAMGKSPHGKDLGQGGHFTKGYSGHGGSHPSLGDGAAHPGVHQGAKKFIDHILKFKEGMSLTADQEQKLRELKTQYTKDRIKMKATIQLANIDLHELLRDEKASLSDIENHLKNVHALKADLYMASIKAKRNAKSVLTTEQQSRMNKIHERIKSHGGNMAHASGYSRGEKGKGGY